MDLSSAYASAVAQFRSLRAELQVARSVALAEAEHLGMEFGPSQVDITFAKEQKALHTFRDTTAQDHTAETERKRWKAVVEREGRPVRHSSSLTATPLDSPPFPQVFYRYLISCWNPDQTARLTPGKRAQTF